ncbi:MAG: glycosyltransferase [Candidatus Moranbacteria bacterium]|nr:glycosyltransferase [Candidatus Moranbacteria bacterium]
MRESEKKLATIIIAVYKNVDILRLCLDSIYQNVSKDFPLEIIVVDIEATESIRDLAQIDYPHTKYIPCQENVGFAKALNTGIKEARGEYIISLNPDIIIKKNSIETLVQYLKDNPKTGIAGPALLDFNGSSQASCFKFYTPWMILYRRTFIGRLWFAKKALKDFAIKVNDKKPQKIKGWLMGSALALRKEKISKVGLMDERYFMYFEDVDWCRRFYEAGYDIVFVPKAKMFHYHTQSSKSNGFWSLFLNKMTLIHVRSGIKYFLKFKSWKVSRKRT